MVDILLDSIKDTAKTLPVLFIAFFLVDYLVNVLNKDNHLVEKLSKYNCLGGALLGIIPQCGIPVAMAKLYSGGLISIGMLMAVFISSSDEALIIIGAHPEKLLLMFEIMFCKVILGVLCGYILNLIIKERNNRFKIYDIACDCVRCKTDKNIIVRNLVYTLKVFIFLVITVFFINLGMERVGEEGLNVVIGGNSYLQPIYASLIGMIPSCMSSVVIAEGYIKGIIGFGPLIAGLCSNTGFGILVIFKELGIKKGLKIAVLLQIISITLGELIYIVSRF